MNDESVSVDYPAFLPSNGSEMLQFSSDFCENCDNPDELLWQEKQEGCGCKFIIEATAKNESPEPWVVKDGKPHCLNFRKQAP